MSTRFASVRCSVSALRGIHFREYALRFVLGGLVTVATGLIAQGFGPDIGGLFLAFPAIFPASATLIARHEREKKEKHGMDGAARGRQIASRDAAGAVLGAVGLLAFAAWVWQMMPRLGAVATLLLGAGLWLLVSVALWWRRKDCWLAWARGAPPPAPRRGSASRRSAARGA